MTALTNADNGLEQLDGLQIHDVTITRGEIGAHSAYIARCSGCIWAVAGPPRDIRALADHHRGSGE